MSFLEQHQALMGLLEVLELENGSTDDSDHANNGGAGGGRSAESAMETRDVLSDVDSAPDLKSLAMRYSTASMKLSKKPHYSEGKVYHPLVGWATPEEVAAIELPKITDAEENY